MTNEKKGIASALEDAQKELEGIDKEQKPKTYARQEKVIKALEVAHNQTIRAEKAEKAAKAPKPEKVKETPIKPTETGTPTNYSLKDIRALNSVHDEDVERVEKFAKGEGISIPEALANEDLKAILKNREEIRKSADATSTGAGKRGTSKTTGKELLKKFNSTKEVPESDEEIDKLVEAELKEKMGSE